MRVKFYVCPYCRHQLLKKKLDFFCPKCKHVYPLTRGTNVFLVNLDKNQKYQKDLYEKKAAINEDIKFEILRDQFGFKFPRFLKFLKVAEFLRKKETKNNNVLDIGCNTGHNLNRLSTTFDLKGYGIDISVNAIRQANKYKIFGNHFAVAQASQLPFLKDTFDGIVSFDVLEHLDKQKEFLLELMRVLKPNGWFIVYCVGNQYKYTFHWLQWVIRKKLGFKNAGQEYGFWEKGGHNHENLVDPEKSKKVMEKFCSDMKIIPFHGFFTLIFDIYFTPFLNGPFYLYLKYFKSKRIFLFEQIYLFLYGIIYNLLLRTLSIMDSPWTLKGYGNGFFIVGSKK